MTSLLSSQRTQEAKDRGQQTWRLDREQGGTDLDKKHIMWIIAAIFIFVNLMLLREAYTTWGPIKRVESIASAIIPQILQILEDRKTSVSPELLTSEPVLVIWTNNGKLYKDVQQLLPITLWPQEKDDIAYLAAITRNDVQDGTYTDGQPGYQITYIIQLVSYSNAQVLAETILYGSSSPYVKHKSGPAYGTPPTDDDIAFWIKSQLGGY